MDVLMGSGLLIMIPMILFFYFVMIRPQRKKDKQIKEMLKRSMNWANAMSQTCTSRETLPRQRNGI